MTKVAIIISGALGLPALYALAAQEAVVGVAVPRLPQAPDEADQLALAAAGLGLPVLRLELAAALGRAGASPRPAGAGR